MKKRYVTSLVAAVMSLSAMLALSACGKNASDKNGETTPDLTLAPTAASTLAPTIAAPTLAVTPTPTAAVNNTSSEAKTAYYNALDNLLKKGTLPDGTEVKQNATAESDQSKFAIYDVDKDGKDELIVIAATRISSDQLQVVYEYDTASKKLVSELSEYPEVEFYDNGMAKANWSHNQGVAGSFWPYTLYKFDSTTNKYKNVGMVDAWDKNFAATKEGESFPDSVDTSKTGIVYYIMKNGTIETVAPVDASAYNTWYDSYMKGASKVSVQYKSLTAENIASVK